MQPTTRSISGLNPSATMTSLCPVVSLRSECGTDSGMGKGWNIQEQYPVGRHNR